jgi:hypothetical protein
MTHAGSQCARARMVGRINWVAEACLRIVNRFAQQQALGPPQMFTQMSSMPAEHRSAPIAGVAVIQKSACASRTVALEALHATSAIGY